MTCATKTTASDMDGTSVPWNNKSLTKSLKVGGDWKKTRRHGRRSWRLGVLIPWKYVGGSEYVLTPENVTFFHSKLFSDNSASNTSSRMKDLCQKWKVKLIFRGAWDSLMAWPDPLIFRQIYATARRKTQKMRGLCLSRSAKSWSDDARKDNMETPNYTEWYYSGQT